MGGLDFLDLLSLLSNRYKAMGPKPASDTTGRGSNSAANRMARLVNKA